MIDVEPVDLTVAHLHPSVDDPALNSMNFLNEVAQHYPDAVSLAAGRPYEEFFDAGVLHGHLDTFRRHLAEDLGLGPAQVDRRCSSTAGPRASCTT